MRFATPYSLFPTPCIYHQLHMPSDVKTLLSSGVELTDRALERLLPSPAPLPPSIHRAMRHSVFAGGKRLRPILCMEAARMVQRDLPVGELPARLDERGGVLGLVHTH